MADSFNARTPLAVGDRTYDYFSLRALSSLGDIDRLPFSLRILLENLLRTEDGSAVTDEDIRCLASWNPAAHVEKEIAFTPARVLLQDFTGVPAVVDLAAMREAMAKMGGDPTKINPLQPAELVIDHSVQVDSFAMPESIRINTGLEYQRNRERYAFLRWGQDSFENFKVVPPETGIVHQVNLEFLARVVFPGDEYRTDTDGNPLAYPDTLVGTDSHTTMINGLGVLGWGVGGIEAEAAMLGQPVSMLIPKVVGFKLSGRLPEGATATDLVLTVTQMLRAHGVVGKFVEFYGPGLADLPLADRATIANMAPEYGATCGIFPVDNETLRYLRFSGRSDQHVALVEAYMKAQGLFHSADSPEAVYTETMELDLSTVEPSIAGPKRPQDRIPLTRGKQAFHEALPLLTGTGGPANPPKQVGRWEGEGGQPEEPLEDFSQSPSAVRFTMKSAEHVLHHGSVVIAAITSCTNTSNPSVMVASGLLAKKAAMRGLTRKPWVKTSLAPGSKVVTNYLQQSGLLNYLDQVGFNLVGYGCTTCIAEGTPVLLANGTTRRIEDMPSAGGAVLFGPDSDGRLGMALQSEMMEQGLRDCISLTLQDGRTLTCTPDHELLCADGRWVRADELEPGRDRVVVGLEAPLDEPGIDEAGYSLVVGNMTFTMTETHERLRTLAFARLLGHLLCDGSISIAGQGRMHVGQAVDREMVLNDIEMLTGKRPAATQYDERKWSIVLPKELTEAIITLDGVRVGQRIHQSASLPAFVLADDCPVSVVREFLGGIFGADGHGPTLNRYGKREEEASLSAPAFSQTSTPEHVDQLVAMMDDLTRLLSRCGVMTEGTGVYQYPTRQSASSYPTAQDGAPRIEVRLELPDGLSFVERVGFRYCVDKALRASAAAVYWRMVDGIGRQRIRMAERVAALHEEQSDLSFPQARRIAAAELIEQQTPVHEHYTLLKGTDRFSRLPNGDGRKFRPLHRDSAVFPSPVELFRELGVRDWFAPLGSRDTTDYTKRYCVEKESLTLPTFALRVIDRREAGLHTVYDLAVDDLHAFVAGTVAVHNCIGNSGPLPTEISNAINQGDLVATSVLSGNRNFEGRINPDVRANYLMSPPLVVAYAHAGRMDIDLYNEPLGIDADGEKVYLRDIWPTQAEVQQVMEESIQADMFRRSYDGVYAGGEEWNRLDVPEGDLYEWDNDSTYVKNPPYFTDMTREAPSTVSDIHDASVLAVLGHSITTDHISPAGSIKVNSPAGQYLIEHGVEPSDFNSYGSRRGNHEVMMRGTFANVRLRNQLAPGTEGGFTTYLPTGEVTSIFDASMRYQESGTPLIILAGKEYGSGSSRDWAAKGPRLLGVRAVIAESYERIHRSNLVGMGVLPLEFMREENAEILGLTGHETYDIIGLSEMFNPGYSGDRTVKVLAKRKDAATIEFTAKVRIDTPQEMEYYRHGGILQYVIRQLLEGKSEAVSGGVATTADPSTGSVAT